MAKIKKYQTLEEGILLLQKAAKDKELSFAEIFSILSGEGKSLMLLLLSLPFCQPLQIPGLSTPFGLVIAFIGGRLAFGKQIWLPKKLLSKRISSQLLKKITDTALSLIKKIKYLVPPRCCGLSRSPGMEIMNGLILSILGVFLALPLPIPFSNLIAAWSIFFIALGRLEDNGIFLLLGYLVFLLALAFFVTIFLTTQQLYQAS